MAMDAGTVTIEASGDPDAGSAGTMARAIYDDYKPKVDTGALTGTDLQGARQNIADLCNSVAAGVVAHIVANGKAKITTSDSELQLLPAVLAEDEPTKAPAGDKLLAIV